MSSIKQTQTSIRGTHSKSQNPPQLPSNGETEPLLHHQKAHHQEPCPAHSQSPPILSSDEETGIRHLNVQHSTEALVEAIEEDEDDKSDVEPEEKPEEDAEEELGS